MLYEAVILLALLIRHVLSKSSTSITVLGATGVLGQSICVNCLLNQNKVYASYKSQEKASSMLQTLKRDRRLTAYPQLFELDFESFEATSFQRSSVDLPGLNVCSPSSRHILVNSAGIIRTGHDFHDIYQQLLINSLMPMHMSYGLVAGSFLPKNLSMIHVSSGDGESVYLHSDVWRDIQNLQSIDDWFSYMKELVTVDTSKSTIIKLPREFAYGMTPGYSLSKALLNRGVVLLDKFCKLNNIPTRIIAICPGNFLSPMTTQSDYTDESETTESSAFIDPATAALHIMDVAINEDYSSGKFYRYGKEISW